MKGKQVKVEIWDTGGQERFRTITKNYYGRAMGALMVYDCTNERSFNDIRNWVRQLNSQARCSIAKVLVAAKSDNPEKKIDPEMGRGLAEGLKMKFFETSSRMNINVDKPFEYLVEQIINKNGQENGKNTKILGSTLKNDNREKKCC